MPTREPSIVQAVGVVAAYQTAKEVDTRRLAGASIGRGPYKGIIVRPLPGQTRVRVINAASKDAGNATPYVPWLDVTSEKCTALAALAALLFTSDGDVVSRFNQVITRVRTLGCALPAAPALLPYLAAFITKSGVVLHGPYIKRTAFARTASGKASQESGTGCSPMAALLPSASRRMLE